MNINLFTGDTERYMELLLDADPCRELVMEYLTAGELFVADDEAGPLCVCVCASADDNTVELKNLATRSDMRERGLAREMIGYVLQYYKGKYENMLVGTASSSPYHLNFYQRCGFAYSHTDYGFFVRNYPEPVIDNGVLCEDMVYMTQTL